MTAISKEKVRHALKKYPLRADRPKPVGVDHTAETPPAPDPMPLRWTWESLGGDTWDQLESGSCGGFAGMKQWETQHRIEYGIEPPLTSRIWPYTIGRVIDENANPHPLEQVGTTPRAIMEAMWRYGILLEEDWPSTTGWETRDRGMKNDLRLFYRAFANRIKEFARIELLDNVIRTIHNIKLHLLHHPIFVALIVDEGWVSPAVDGQVTPSGQLLGGHGIVLSGYDDLRYNGSVQMHNSWGSEYGVGGYVWMTYDDFARIVFGLWVITLRYPWRVGLKLAGTGRTKTSK